MKLSIILPCYNVASYLPRCFESILSQSVDYDYEIIAINDASRDNTLEVLYDYSSKNSKIRVFNKDYNEKLSGARTTGIINAVGEYIMHIDPDDYLLPNTLNRIFTNSSEQFDLKIFNIFIEDHKGCVSKKYSLNTPYEFNLCNSKDEYAFFKQFTGGAIYSKVFNKKLLEDMHYFDFNYNIGEDIAFNSEIFNRCRVIHYNPIPIYFYCYNEKSLVHETFNVERLSLCQSWIANVRQLFVNDVLYKESKARISSLVERYTIGLLLQILSVKNRKTRNELFELWGEFLTSAFVLINPRKLVVYRFFLKLPNNYVKGLFFLLFLGQYEPYVERIRKYLFRK